MNAEPTDMLPCTACSRAKGSTVYHPISEFPKAGGRKPWACKKALSEYHRERYRRIKAEKLTANTAKNRKGIFSPKTCVDLPYRPDLIKKKPGERLDGSGYIRRVRVDGVL